MNGLASVFGIGSKWTGKVPISDRFGGWSEFSWTDMLKTAFPFVFGTNGLVSTISNECSFIGWPKYPTDVSQTFCSIPWKFIGQLRFPMGNSLAGHSIEIRWGQLKTSTPLFTLSSKGGKSNRRSSWVIQGRQRLPYGREKKSLRCLYTKSMLRKSAMGSMPFLILSRARDWPQTWRLILYLTPLPTTL